MIHFNMAFNLSIEQTYVPADSQHIVAEQAYFPLLEILENHPQQKASFFVDGKTNLFLQEKYPGLVTRIKKGMERGQFEIGTYTYTHPILSLIPLEDTWKQIERGIEIDEGVWGKRPKGLLLPEGGWDPSLPYMLKKMQLEWLIIPHLNILRDFPDIEPHELHKAFKLRGILDSEVLGLSVVYEVGDKKRIMEVMMDSETEESKKCILDYIISLAKKGVDQLIFIAKEDAEFIYHSGKRKERQKYGTGGKRNIIGEPLKDGVKVQSDKFDTFLSELEKIKDINFTLIQEFLLHHPPQKEFSLRPAFGWYKSFQEWLGGSEKVGYMIDEARIDIKAAEYVIMLSEKMGFETCNAKQLVGDAWDSLMNAEISVGRRACAHPLGEVSRVIRSMEDAIRAKELAKKAITEGLHRKDQGMGI